MSATHTPGPWHAVSNGRYIEINIGESQYDPSIAECCPSKFSFNEDVEKANARLIAAAPDLLEALELALFVRGTSDDTSAVRIKMEQALKKAKGETL